MTTATDSRKRGLSNLELVLLALLLGGSLTFLHYQIVDTVHPIFQIQWHRRIIGNTGPYPDQYRILTYYFAEFLIRLGLTFQRAHSLVRVLFTSASFFVLYKYLSIWFKPTASLLGIFIMAAVTPIGYLFYGMQPTDPLNTLIYFLFFLALAKGGDWWLFPLVILGMLNRDTAILLPLAFVFTRYGERPLKYWLPRFLALSLLAVGIYAGLRWVYGFKEPYAPTSPLHYWNENLTDWKTWVQVIGFFNIFLILAWRDFRSKPLFFKRITLLLPFFMAVHFTVGYMREVRYFLAILPILLPLTLSTLEPVQDLTTEPEVEPPVPTIPLLKL